MNPKRTPNFDIPFSSTMDFVFSRSSFRIFFSVALTLIGVLISISEIFAGRLPVKIYTSADGLANSAITHVYRDSLGFIWFTTRDGLSRFDGMEFANFRLRESNSAHVLFRIYESRKGVYWIVGGDGLYRVERKQNSEVQPLAAPRIGNRQIMLDAVKVSDEGFDVLYEDRAGNFWAGGEDGLFLIEDAGRNEIRKQKIEIGEIARIDQVSAATTIQGFGIRAIAESSDGTVWISCRTGLLRRLSDGRFIHYPLKRQSNREFTESLEIDETGRLWLAHSSDIYVLKPENESYLANAENFTSRPLPFREKLYAGNDGTLELPVASGAMFKLNFQQSNGENSAPTKIFKAANGTIWFPVNRALISVTNGKFRRLIDDSDALNLISNIAEDWQGNLWLISGNRAARLNRQGFTTYNPTNGLVSPNVNAIYETADGIAAVHGDWLISRISENSIETKRLEVPKGSRILYASTIAVPDAKKNWWALADSGLYEFADFKFKKTYRKSENLKADTLFCGFRDSTGSLWFSTRGTAEDAGLTRIDAVSGELHTFSEIENYPSGKSVYSFAEDRNGNLWFGFYEGGIARFRSSRFEYFGASFNLPERSGIASLLIDRNGGLWAASGSEGLFRAENPTADEPQFARLTTNEGLSSNNVRYLLEDLTGNIYIGTVRGVDRLNPLNGQIRNFSVADGLASDFILSGLRDSKGVLWFGTPNGLSRFEPQPDSDSREPTIFLSSLKVAGVSYDVSALGQSSITDLALNADQNNLEISFFSVGEGVRYQYQLEGAPNAAWSDASEQRTINFANLSPGEYQLFVRAVNSAGQTSQNPATVFFEISPPFWRSWQFLTAMILLASGGVFALDRYRVRKTRQVKNALDDLKRSREERLIELERVRTRIATDLHDDIGASLTQIAVLSEVAKSQMYEAQTDEPTTWSELSPLERISAVSNELVDVMSDIVWAINPRKDTLRDLIQRMRRFASDVFSAKNIRVDFNAPADSKVQLGANVRREIFVIFKECVNNIARHSKAKRAEVYLSVEKRRLKLRIADNGRGFDLEKLLHESFIDNLKGGNGLINIQKRVEELGGEFKIVSFPGGGTTVSLEIPLNQEAAEENSAT